MFFDIAGVGQSNVMGQRASTQTVRTRGVVVDVPFTVLEDTDFIEVKDCDLPRQVADRLRSYFAAGDPN